MLHGDRAEPGMVFGQHERSAPGLETGLVAIQDGV